MKQVLLLLLIGWMLGCHQGNQTGQETAVQPNIVLIIADDMNWNDCGAYGHPFIKTPNIDQLAATGMRFDHGYVTTSSCSPSRASIITGRYPHNTGAEQLHWGLPAGTATFVQQLQAAGYYTASAGKWHMGDHIRPHFDTIYEASKAGFQLPTGANQAPLKMVATQPSGCEDWVTALRNRPKNQPFFMWLAALDPHRAYETGTLESPHTLDDVVVPSYLPDVPAVREDLRQYYDEIGRLDQYVGQVVAELTAQGVTEQTLVIFISDNGRPFPRDKTSLYEGGIKSPWMVKWPAVIEAGSTTSSLVSTVDLAPTICEVAGIEPLTSFAGHSFLPVLKNPQVETRTYAFGEDHWHDYEDHARAVFTQHWKLIRNDYVDLAPTPSADVGRSPTWQAMRQLKADNQLTPSQLSCFLAPRPPYELYDLIQDPNESQNLAADTAYAKIKHELLQVLAAWTEETADFLPSERTPDEFDRLTGQPDHTVRKRPRPDKKAMFGTYGKY